jgi:hypothetical protein
MQTVWVLELAAVRQLTTARYLLSDIRRLQEKFKPSKTNEGDCESTNASFKRFYLRF